MSNTTTLALIKLALRITTDAFDDELTNLIEAALLDLGVAGVNGYSVSLCDKLVLLAVTTYVKMHFGEPDEYDRLKKSYDEQKAQLSMSSPYTIWEV